MVKQSEKTVVVIATLIMLLMWLNIAVQLQNLYDISKDTLQMLCEVNSRVEQSYIEAEKSIADENLYSNYIGEFVITHYCTCEKCCGKSDGITASGKMAKPNYTVAVDTTVIPLGTMLNINGQLYLAEDKGGAIKGNRIDICVNSHEEAIQLGKYTADVFEVTTSR